MSHIVWGLDDRRGQRIFWKCVNVGNGGGNFWRVCCVVEIIILGVGCVDLILRADMELN